MSIAIETYLEDITSHLHPDLISPDIFPQVLAHIQVLKPIFPSLSETLLECRLGDNLTQVDFTFQLHPLTQPLPEKFLASPIWRSFQTFNQEWANPTSNIHQNVTIVGMEFDVNESPSTLPIPGIFFGLDREKTYYFPKLVSDTLALLDYPLSPLIESNLKRCTDFLPDEVKLSHFAAMLSRPGLGVRVNVAEIPCDRVLDYLLKIGWNDPTESLSPLMSQLSEWVDYIILTFDVGETIYPRIGLECYLEKQPRYEPRWQLLLDNLVAQGLCTPTKRDALLTWPGFIKNKDRKQDNLNWESVFSLSMYSLYWKRINHIKIVYQPGVPLEAKGYLNFSHHWFAL
jgi:hypothetical protein